MVPQAACSLLPELDCDLYLALAVAHLSSCPSARDAASAWLAAYDGARGNGASEGVARCEPAAASHLVVDGSAPGVPIEQTEGIRA